MMRHSFDRLRAPSSSGAFLNTLRICILGLLGLAWMTSSFVPKQQLPPRGVPSSSLSQLQQQQQQKSHLLLEPHASPRKKVSSRGKCWSTLLFSKSPQKNNPDEDDENEYIEYNDFEEDLFNPLEGTSAASSTDGPEKSQMLNYISDFLQKENGESPQERQSASSASSQQQQDKDSEDNAFTHLIAIPMGECHELAIELESVQRAILYHCPALVHACLVPQTTRLPLLYVQAPSSSSQTTEALQKIVQQVVQKHIYVTTDKKEQQQGLDVQDEDDVAMDGINEDGHRPLVLTFQSLEIDGANNQALHTVALPDDPGTRRLQDLVQELQQEISTRLQWETLLPFDEHIDSSSDDNNNNNNNSQIFRPRVPFMRIPPNFQDYLDPLPEGRDEDFRTPDEGGNGISPIFWCTWWDDVFGTARCRDIAIYPRSSSTSPSLFLRQQQQNVPTINNEKKNGLDEDAFRIPHHQRTDLPKGNAALTKQEAKFEKYQAQRMKQAQYDMQQDVQDQKSLTESRNSVQEEGEDIMLERTRERLESLYQQDNNMDAGMTTSDKTIKDKSRDADRPKVDTSILDDWMQERIRKANEAQGNTMYDDREEADRLESSVEGREKKTTEDNYVAETITSKDDSDDSNNSDQEASLTNTQEQDTDADALDDWTRQRIQKAVDSREVVQSKVRLSAPRNKVPIEDNPIFKKFKEGTLVPPSQKQEDDTPTIEELPPFPSREHFVGFWKVFSSPTGFPPDDEGGDGSRSENLILRVDGTTAAGPILDPETRQKAAGGTWKLIDQDDDDEDIAKLRIRLVIPPKKERILVMEGTAIKRSLASLQDLPPMSKSTFGIPILEEKLKRAQEANEALALSEEERIYCNGKVWIEDAVTKKNKMDIGTFSLMKLDTPRDPKQYTITIPRPIRNQD